MGWSRVLLLGNVLILGLYTAKGEKEACSKSDIEIENGFFSEPDLAYHINKTTQYKCKQGYVTTNGKTSGPITCLQNGWSAQPSCIKSCDRPIFENAGTKSNSTWFKLNDKLDYECHVGYENRHKDTKGSITCNYDGWSDKPSCYERECSIPLLDPNLIVDLKKEKYKVGDLLKFSCRPGHRVGPDSVQCYDFGWSPSFPTCKGQVGSCVPPPELLHGVVKGTKKEEYVHGEAVEYDCKPGFLLKGPNKIECVDGKWTTLPTCVEDARMCVDVPELEHGSVKFPMRYYRHGDSVEFTCLETFTMIGSGSVSCISGKWTQLPQCIATDQLEKCKAPRLSAVGAKLPEKSEFNHNFSISYKCRGKQEYKHSICINGRWDPEPTCTRVEKKSCPPPPQIPNARVMETTVKYWEGEKVSIICQDNYLIQDTEEMVCRDGRWQSLPRCVGLPCGPPPSIHHGIVSHELDIYQHGEEVTYSCSEGFGTDGSAFIKCVGGKWSQPPACIKTDCDSLPRFENAVLIEKKKKSYRSGEKVMFKCAPSYQMDGSNIVTCVNRMWIGDLVCKEISCTAPEVKNGKALSTKTVYKENERYQYNCQQGFVYEERGDAVCTASGWSPQPSCKEMTCKMPSITNGDYSPKRIKHRAGDQISYTCNNGFHPLTRENVVMCTNTGWVPVPRCGFPPCGFPQIKNGYLSGTYAHPSYFPLPTGTYVYYYCNSGFTTPSGRNGNYIRCTVQGWEPAPSCRKICYTNPIENGKFIQQERSYRQDESVKVQCYHGYSLPNGQDTVTCTENGWSPQPRCIRVNNSCGNPPHVENAVILTSPMTKYPPDSRVRYECNKHFEIFGEVEVMCQNGNWTEPPKCKDSAGKCGPPPPIENGDITSFPLQEYAPSSSVEYQCQNLHQLKGKKKVTCRNGKWSEPPKCLHPCVISEEIMERHNITFKWIGKQKLYSKSGELVEFSCKSGYNVANKSPPFRTRCIDGRINYPSCIKSSWLIG